LRATALTQPGPVRRTGRAALRDPRRPVRNRKVPHTKWTEARGPVSCVMHALCTRHRLVWPGDCSKPDRVARGLAGCVRAVLNPRDLVQGYFRDKFLEWAANGGSRLAAVIEKYSWVGDAASCVAGGIKGG
jgi:hypothetical protein